MNTPEPILADAKADAGVNSTACDLIIIGTRCAGHGALDLSGFFNGPTGPSQ
jgi:nucleotide-binding universal stress UspA family protein